MRSNQHVDIVGERIKIIAMKLVPIESVAKIVGSIISDGALCMDSEEDVRDMARQFANGLNLHKAERTAFATLTGFDSAADMDTPRE